MHRLSTMDLEGEISLKAESGRTFPIFDGYAALANKINSKRQDSFVIYLKETDNLPPGRSCLALFKFKFGDLENFKITVAENELLELKEGERKIGEFRIRKVLNNKFLAQ